MTPRPEQSSRRCLPVVLLVASLCAAVCAGTSFAAEPDRADKPRLSIKSLKRLDDTIQRLGGEGDNWHMTWADNDKVYVSLCDGDGMPGTPLVSKDRDLVRIPQRGKQFKYEYNSRLYAIDGDMPHVKFEFLPGYPNLLNEPGTNINRYYNFGTLALDGKIYQFLSTQNYPFGDKRARFAGAKLIYSPDNGVTWRNQDGTSPVRWEKWDERNKANMVFFDEPDDAFALTTVLQMGRGYELNQDGFVYLYAPNGTVEGTMNELVLCRVPKDRLLAREAYEFYAGTDARGRPSWSKRIEDRDVVHTFPAGWVNRGVHPYAWHPSVIYFPPSGEYLMANWGMGVDSRGKWFKKPSYLGFWTAPQPWGPWKQVYEEQAWTPGGDTSARAYQPQIAPKWISADGERFWLVWTDYQGHLEYYQFNAQQVEVTFDDR